MGHPSLALNQPGQAAAAEREQRGRARSKKGKAAAAPGDEGEGADAGAGAREAAGKDGAQLEGLLLLMGRLAVGEVGGGPTGLPVALHPCSCAGHVQRRATLAVMLTRQLNHTGLRHATSMLTRAHGHLMPWASRPSGRRAFRR